MNTNIVARLFTFGVALFLAWGIGSYAYAQQTTNGFTVETYTKGTPITFAGMDQISEPQKNECFTDSHYGNVELCKDDSQVTDMGTQGDIRAVYSRFPHENSDGTKYFVIRENTDYRLIIYNRSDNTVYKIVNEFPSLEGIEMRWDYSGKYPNRLYYVEGCQFKQYDITNGQSQLIHDFSNEYAGCGKIFMDVEGDSSADSRYWGWMVTWPYDGQQSAIREFIVYDKDADIIVSKLNVDDYKRLGGKCDFFDANGNAAMPKPNMVEMAPSGKKIVLDYSRTWGGYVNAANWQYYGSGIWYVQVDTYGNSISHVYEENSSGAKTYYSEVWADYTDNPTAKITTLGQFYHFRGGDGVSEKLYVKTLTGVDPNTLSLVYEWGDRARDTGTLFDGAYAFDPTFINPVKVCVSSSHSGWSFDINGNELFVCQDDRTDWITATNVLNGNKMNVIYHGDMDYNWRIGFHFGRVTNPDLKGWIPVSTYNYTQDYIGLQNQVFMLELVDNADHPRVWKIAHMRNNYAGNYMKEGYAPISKDGMSIWWGADWMGGDGTVDVYEAKLPYGWWNVLSRTGTVTTPPPPAAVCGNGVKEGSEICDSGANNGKAGYCNATCTAMLPVAAVCGNGLIETGEVCDQNSTTCVTSAGYNGTMQCGTVCTGFLACQAKEFCGDGIKNGVEQCDGTAGVGTHQTCNSSCQLVNVSYCGDGIVNQSTEQCDGTAGVGANQTCNASCQLVQLPYCGDSVVNQSTEQCDGTAGVGANQTCNSSCQLVQVVVNHAPVLISLGVVQNQYIYWLATDADKDSITYLYSIDGAKWVSTTATKLYMAVFTKKGVRTITVKAIDNKGAVSNSKTITFRR
ncbi:MAG: hypothetical protein HQL25_04600 [Candidatus Omnitrophica bacterium]|nr:hypothetical protein [Candidatus Omnitrophota bacterium]